MSRQETRGLQSDPTRIPKRICEQEDSLGLGHQAILLSCNPSPSPSPDPAAAAAAAPAAPAAAPAAAAAPAPAPAPAVRASLPPPGSPADLFACLTRPLYWYYLP